MEKTLMEKVKTKSEINSFVITKFMSDEQKQEVGDIIADVLMNMSDGTKSMIDYYGSDFTWDVIIGVKK
jgi:hypothetical protein|tara:strand:- start:536 stop:742 length:207 start_codon:yes stop_codon:yes gene_type:complete